MDDLLQRITDSTSYAFHGTSQENAQKIKNEGFSVSDDDSGYLGRGVYFYLYDFGAAVSWSKRKNEIPAVLKSEVAYGRCLSLFVRKHREAIQAVGNILNKETEEKVFLGDAINYIAKMVDIEVIQAPQIEVNSIKQESPIDPPSMWVYAKLMLCVRSNENILDTEILL